ncbi:hypothetical protein WDW37_18175 [Bdellovibrionota bacterium FG-1]
MKLKAKGNSNTKADNIKPVLGPGISVQREVNCANSDNVSIVDELVKISFNEQDNQDPSISSAIVVHLLAHIKTRKAAGDGLTAIVSRCLIDGCDIHTLSLSDEILRHFDKTEILEGLMLRARDLLANSDERVFGVLVFKSRLELLYVTGTTNVA